MIEENILKCWSESKKYFKEHNMIGIFLYGSQNYGLETVESNINTKLIITPELDEFIYSLPSNSTGHFRGNKECTFEDIRLMVKNLIKQKFYSTEILFTSYKIINPIYVEEWNKIISAREEIAHYNLFSAVSYMKGFAIAKKNSLMKETIDRKQIFEQFGYDPKQLYHLLRIEEFLKRYTDGEDYQRCLYSQEPGYLKSVKNGFYYCWQAEQIAQRSVENINRICELYTKDSKFNYEKSDIRILLKEVQKEIIKKSISIEL